MRFLLAFMLIATAHLSSAEIQNDSNEKGSLQKIIDDPRIQQVRLETTGCMGTCPIFSITISADGAVEYTGSAYVEFIGSRTGNISKWEVEHLFDFINDTQFFSFRDKYTQNITDQESRYTTVKMFSGKTKTVENYANTAPVRLWALEELILGFEKKTKWVKLKI